jgi:hypothetical protein
LASLPQVAWGVKSVNLEEITHKSFGQAGRAPTPFG